MGRRCRAPYGRALAYSLRFNIPGNQGVIRVQVRVRKRFYKINVRREIRARVLDDDKCEGVTC